MYMIIKPYIPVHC